MMSVSIFNPVKHARGHCTCSRFQSAERCSFCNAVSVPKEHAKDGVVFHQLVEAELDIVRQRAGGEKVQALARLFSCNLHG